MISANEICSAMYFFFFFFFHKTRHLIYLPTKHMDMLSFCELKPDVPHVLKLIHDFPERRERI